MREITNAGNCYFLADENKLIRTEILCYQKVANRGGGYGGVLSVTQGDEKYIAIMIDRGLTRDEIFLTPRDAMDLVNALRRELHKDDSDD